MRQPRSISDVTGGEPEDARIVLLKCGRCGRLMVKAFGNLKSCALRSRCKSCGAMVMWSFNRTGGMAEWPETIFRGIDKDVEGKVE